MNETFRLGTIAGIRIGVNWSVLVIFGLLLVGLSAGRFPMLYPDHSTFAYVLAGITAAVAFFFSLLAHELAHAVVARHANVEVEGITLWLFGGVAKLTGEASDPAADFRIAVVGPLVSFLLGGVFGSLALFAATIGVEGLLLGVVAWLAIINVVLAVFNLVPASPLDGGRILRAVVWWRHGDRLRAAVTASRAGRRFGYLLIALGIALVIFTPGIGGLWFAMIGWFISAAANAEEQHARIQASLRNVRMRDVMSRDPLHVPSGITVGELLDDYVLRHRHSSYPIVDSRGVVVGLVTLDGIRGISPNERATTTVESIGIPVAEVATANPADRIVDLLGQIDRTRGGRVLVLDDGRLVGIVSGTDIARTIELANLLDTPDAR